jgi:hypothetical protein
MNFDFYNFVVANKVYIGGGVIGTLVAAINAMSPPTSETGRYAYIYRFLHGLPLPTFVGGHGPKLPNA